jgi:hypothetical protein
MLGTAWRQAATACGALLVLMATCEQGGCVWGRVGWGRAGLPAAHHGTKQNSVPCLPQVCLSTKQKQGCATTYAVWLTLVLLPCAIAAAGSWLMMMGVAGFARAGCQLRAIRATLHHTRPAGDSPYDAAALTEGGWLTSRLQTPDSPAGSAVARQGSSKAGYVATSEFPAMDGGSYGKRDKSAAGDGQHSTGVSAAVGAGGGGQGVCQRYVSSGTFIGGEAT